MQPRNSDRLIPLTGLGFIVLGIVAFTPVGFASAVGAAILVLVLSILLSVRARAPSLT